MCAAVATVLCRGAPGQQRHRRASTQRGGYNIYEIGSKKTVRNFHGVQRGSLLEFRVAEDLAISDVARVFGLRTSAIRYYEQIGILPPAMRKNGQRRYDDSVLFRLAVVQRACETGFTLEEIRELFFGFPPGTPPPKRWHKLSERKIAELRNRMKRLKLMETLLKRVENCRCNALDECGEKLLQQGRV
jgi:MerR family transcriptional regulator, redox-sensitive transcriptional activator SoxR